MAHIANDRMAHISQYILNGTDGMTVGVHAPFLYSLPCNPYAAQVREQYDSLSPEDQQHCHKAVVTGGRGSEGIENGVNMVQTMYR
eukprot:2310992-Pyramimonas_sp.AAC.1